LIGLLGILNHTMTRIYLYVIVLVKEFEIMTIYTFYMGTHVSNAIKTK